MDGVRFGGFLWNGTWGAAVQRHGGGQMSDLCLYTRNDLHTFEKVHYSLQDKRIESSLVIWFVADDISSSLTTF